MRDRHTKKPVRLRHVDGELLRRRDLADEAASETRRRGLHVRAVHDTWGVAIGYEVVLASGAMTVGPGVAYDCAGREIVSVKGLKLPPPEPPPGQGAGASFAFDLVVAWAEDLATSARSCPAPGRVPLLERPVWRWEAVGAVGTSGVAALPAAAPGVCNGLDVPLARAVVRNGSFVGPVDFSVRRTARALVRPHVAGGRVSAGAALGGAATRSNWAVDVSTSAGGFLNVPQYFAQLSGHPLPDPLLPDVLGPFVTIEKPTRTGFTLRVRCATREGDAAPPALTAKLGGSPVDIYWTGIEDNTGCPPTFSFVALPFVLVLAALDPVHVSAGGGH